jgi:hypothetical protein
LTKIKKLAGKYAEWWTFSPQAPLEKYLVEHDISLPKYWCSDDLVKALNHLLIQKNMNLPHNQDIIMLDDTLQSCFQKNMLYKPHLFEMCKPQLVRAPADIEMKLKTETILKSLTIYCTKDLIYQDPSSVFYLNPHINKLMETDQYVYNWPELVLLFRKFLTNHPEHFSCHLNFVQINKHSPWASLLPFQYFHIDQCEIILKQITKYLGRKPFMTYHCPRFQKPLFPNPQFHKILKFIEDKIDETVLPQFYPPIKI